MDIAVKVAGALLELFWSSADLLVAPRPVRRIVRALLFLLLLAISGVIFMFVAH